MHNEVGTCAEILPNGFMSSKVATRTTIQLVLVNYLCEL